MESPTVDDSDVGPPISAVCYEGEEEEEAGKKPEVRWWWWFTLSDQC